MFKSSITRRYELYVLRYVSSMSIKDCGDMSDVTTVEMTSYWQIYGLRQNSRLLSRGNYDYIVRGWSFGKWN